MNNTINVPVEESFVLMDDAGSRQGLVVQMDRKAVQRMKVRI